MCVIERVPILTRIHVDAFMFRALRAHTNSFRLLTIGYTARQAAEAAKVLDRERAALTELVRE